LGTEEDANEFNDGVDVVNVAEPFVEVADCVVVEAGVVLETDSGVEGVVDVATAGVDEGVEVLDEEACARSVGVEEDVVLVVEFGVVEEGVASEDVEVGVEDDDDWSKDGEVVASDETVDVDEEDEFAVCAEEKLTNKKPQIVNNTSPPTIPIRNGSFFMDFII
jgi:hypothetical protein